MKKNNAANLTPDQIAELIEARNACRRARSAIARAAMAIGEAGWNESCRRGLGLHCRSIDLSLAIDRYTETFLP
jgi:hypothetical protein